MKKRLFKSILIILGDIALAALVLLVFFGSKFASDGEALDIALHGKSEGAGSWQEKFSDKFSEEIIRTDHSYKSPNVSIEINTVETVLEGKPVVYHAADIYIGSVDNFRAYTANGEMSFFSKQNVLEMDRDSDALISISGDFYSYQASCFVVRNGQLYKDDPVSCDICVLYPDGSMEMLREGEYTNQQILEKNPLQIWNFGPSLLDENGNVMESYETNYNVSQPNPRSALGYYEPGHYCFLVVDGRQEGYSEGVDLFQLAEIFRSLGCRSAYNLDGGGSAVMCFNHGRYSRQSNGADRSLGDILLICETEAAE